MERYASVLERRYYEKGPEPGRVIGTMGGRKSEVLTQSKERDKTKKYHGADDTGGQGQKENDGHHPPRFDSGIKVVDQLSSFFALDSEMQEETNGRGDE